MGVFSTCAVLWERRGAGDVGAGVFRTGGCLVPFLQELGSGQIRIVPSGVLTETREDENWT